jgi:uncharacterized protein (TIGR00299 family) protein
VDGSVSGISGDMFLAATLDLGADQDILPRLAALTEKHLPGIHVKKIKLIETKRHGFACKHLEISTSARQHEHGHDLLDALNQACNESGLSENAKEFALSALKRILKVEARLHGERVSSVHLHEAGDPDTFIDILGSALSLDSLGVFDGCDVFCLPLSVGGGTVTFSHGKVSVPAPATAELLSEAGIMINGGPSTRELVTPTGAAILASLKARGVRVMPEMRIEKIGYGGGSMELEEAPNILRMMLGVQEEDSSEIVQLETTVDDVTGEVVGRAVEVLLREGARDVLTIPAVGKKGRPAQIIQVICDRHDVEHLSSTLMSETGTLGVRVHHLARHVANREVMIKRVKLAGKPFSLKVKAVRDSKGRVTQWKAEYDDLAKISEALKLPLRNVNRLVDAQLIESFA